MLFVSGCDEASSSTGTAVPSRPITAAATLVGNAVGTSTIHPASHLAPTHTPGPLAGVSSPSPLAEQESQAREGWTLYQRPDAGFSIELPSEWTQIDMDNLSLKVLLDN